MTSLKCYVEEKYSRFSEKIHFGRHQGVSRALPKPAYNRTSDMIVIRLVAACGKAGGGVMPLTLLDPPGRLYAQYRAVEDALDFARKMHEQQTTLKSGLPQFYDPDVHAIVLAFILRIVGRKIDTLAAAFRACIRPGQRGEMSERTAELQSALQQYNAAVACRDAWDNPVDASINVLDMAFDCFASLEGDIRLFEQRN